MKEIMIIERPINNINDDDYIHIYHFARKEYLKYKIEKYPETFEELKELCKDLEGKNVFIINAENCIEFNGLYFWIDGSITTTENNEDIWATKTNLTPARQWQIIKSLIGDER